MNLIIIFIVSACSLVYELLLSTLSSYLLGNSILQFSLTIGFFLFGLGVGSQLVKKISNPFVGFINTEIALGLLGAFSVLIIKLMYINLADYNIIFTIFYLLYVSVIGILTGFEIPLMTEIIEKIQKTKKNIKLIIGDIFSYDYIGALVATLLFPFLFLPYFGLTYTAFFVGSLNIIAALIFITQKPIKEILIKNKLFSQFVSKSIISLIIIFAGLLFSLYKFEKIWDHFFYKEPILLKTHSKYQEIVITKRGKDIRLLLDGHLQFLSLDEHRYHSSLFSQAKNYLQNLSGEKQILILGGGDGLLARNIIQALSGKKFNITLVDLDPKITYLAKTFPILVNLNQNSLNNPNVKVLNQDAFNFLLENKQKYNVILADFPDPRNIEIAKLYSKEFYFLIKKHLKNGGIFTTQAGNAFFTKESFWCIYKTLQSIGVKPFAYHAYIPSFGDWGFVGFKKGKNIPKLTGEYILTTFDKDYQVDLKNLKENTLDNEIIVQYYLKGRKKFTE